MAIEYDSALKAHRAKCDICDKWIYDSTYTHLDLKRFQIDVCEKCMIKGLTRNNRKEQR